MADALSLSQGKAMQDLSVPGGCEPSFRPLGNPESEWERGPTSR
jgi:hypothetical protein